MISRRIIAHVRSQDWFAVFIDLVIVVVGVFIGIQVANWNEDRAERARAHGYIERIGSDLVTDIEGYRNRQAFWNQVAAYGATGLRYAETGDAAGLDQWKLLIAYFQASQVAEFWSTDTTYEELKSAGELRLLADVGLRERLARYYTNAANPALTERPAYRTHVRGIIPLDLQHHIWDHCYGSNADGEQEFHDCASPADEARVAAVVDAIRGDADLMGELRYWMSTMRVAGIISRDRIALAEQLLERIMAEPGSARVSQAP
ncbi:MAG: hypothetical protein KA911_06880 [Xanthomonadales bacterium]|nr:hypothetical protein [Xanthomonadales bacterium]